MVRRSKLNERLVQIQQDAYSKKMGSDPPKDAAVEDEDVIQVGDNEIHYHYSAPQEQSPQEPTQPPAPEPKPPLLEDSETGSSSSGLPPWAKAAVVVAGLASAGGLGAAIPWMLGAYNKSDTTNITQGEQQLGVDVVPGGAVK